MKRTRAKWHQLRQPSKRLKNQFRQPLEEIKKQLETLATKDDIPQLKGDVDKLTSQVMLRLHKLEGRCFDAEKEIHSLKCDVTSVKKEREHGDEGAADTESSQ